MLALFLYNINILYIIHIQYTQKTDKQIKMAAKTVIVFMVIIFYVKNKY